MGRPSHIYGLYDLEGCLRYIGKANDPHKRLKQHMEKCGKLKSPVGCWLKSLRDKKLKPIMRVLDSCCESDWQRLETQYIFEARLRGENLLNIAAGGNAPPSSPCGLVRSIKRHIGCNLKFAVDNCLWDVAYKVKYAQLLFKSLPPKEQERVAVEYKKQHPSFS